MNIGLLLLGLFFSIINIAYIDFILLREWTKCRKCGFVADRWHSFLLPTTLEILLFLAGIGIGVTLK